MTKFLGPETPGPYFFANKREKEAKPLVIYACLAEALPAGR